MSSTISIKLSNASTERSKNLRLARATLSSTTVYAAIYDSPNVQASKVTEFPADVQAQLDSSELELQLVLQNVISMEQLAVLNLEEMKSTSMQQLLDGALSAAGSETLKLSLQCAKPDSSAPKLTDIIGSGSVPASSAKPPVLPSPSGPPKAMKSDTVGGSVRLKVTNVHTEKSKNVRVMKAAASSASTYEWLYNHEGLQATKILEFPEEQQSGLDENKLELEITVSSGGTENVCSSKQLQSTTLMKILEEFPNFDSAIIAMSIQVVEAKDEEPATTDSASVPAAPTGAAKRGANSANHAGSLHLVVTNTHNHMSKNVRVMPSTFSATTSGYDWMYQHDGLKVAKILEFPKHQEAMDKKTKEIQVTIHAAGIDDQVISAEEMCFKTMSQILDPIIEQLSNPKATITMYLEVVDVKVKEEEEEEEGTKEEKEEELSEEAKEAARLKKKEEEAAFWAAEEAKMAAQAEERKRQKEAKLQAALQAEKAALEAAQKQAAEKEAAIKAEEEERLAKREAQKKAALEAEQQARKQIEEERQMLEEEENLEKQKEVEELQSKRKRTSLISQELAGRSSSAFAGTSLAPFDDDGEKSEDDELLMDEEDKELSKIETDAILTDDEDRQLDIMQSQSLDDEILMIDEEKDLGAFESNAMLFEDEDKELEAMDMAVSLAAMTTGNRSEDAHEASDEEQMEKKRLEEQEKEEDVAGASRGLTEESPEDAARRENVDQMERLLETKENEEKRENERMLALERKAAELEKASAVEPTDESPRDRSVNVDEVPKKKKGGPEARLRTVEQSFVADPARKRSADVIPLSVQFNEFLRKLRKAVNQVKLYQEARQEAEAARTKMVEDFGSLSETTPLHDLVGKKANIAGIEDVDARKAAEAAKTQGVRSYKSIDQLVELQGNVSGEEYQEEIVKYIDAWDEAVSTRVNKAMQLHKKLEQDVLHYENKVSKLRSQAHDLEANDKFLSSKQAARLNRNEMKLNDAWQIHELECSSICNLLEEITQQGWHDLFPIVKSSIEWEIRRMEREISTYGLGLPGLLKTLGNTVNDVPMPETEPQLHKEILDQRNANRVLVRKINVFQTILRGRWTTKSEFQQVMQDQNVVL